MKIFIIALLLMIGIAVVMAVLAEKSGELPWHD